MLKMITKDQRELKRTLYKRVQVLEREHFANMSKVLTYEKWAECLKKHFGNHSEDLLESLIQDSWIKETFYPNEYKLLCQYKRID